MQAAYGTIIELDCT